MALEVLGRSGRLRGKLSLIFHSKLSGGCRAITKKQKTTTKKYSANLAIRTGNKVARVSKTKENCRKIKKTTRKARKNY